MSQLCINIARCFIFTCLNTIKFWEITFIMNAVLVAVAVMLLLSLLRVQVIVAIIVGALTGGMIGGLGISETINTFTTGLGNSASNRFKLCNAWRFRYFSFQNRTSRCYDSNCIKMDRQ